MDDMKYPDISDILALKAEGRRQRARLNLGEKLDALDALRERVRPIVEARKARGAGRQGHVAEFFADSPLCGSGLKAGRVADKPRKVEFD